MTNQFSLLIVLTALLFGIITNTSTLQAQQMNHTTKAQFTPQSSQTAPDNYVFKCSMYDDVTVYYVMPNDEVLKGDGLGNFYAAGQKVAPPAGRLTEFDYMITIHELGITYAVDKQGQVWQKIYPYKEIVGQIKAR
jgi:hypothetical protein